MPLPNTESFIGVSNSVGEPFSAKRDRMIIYISGDIGTGQVRIERKGTDGEFKIFPTLVYTEADAWVVNVNANATIRIVVDQATNVNVEMV